MTNHAIFRPWQLGKLIFFVCTCKNVSAYGDFASEALGNFNPLPRDLSVSRNAPAENMKQEVKK